MTPKNKKTEHVRLSVEMLSKNGKPDCLRTITEDGIPIWSRARIIDGALYALDSTHADLESAVKRQNKLREESRSAQAYEYARPKLIPQPGGNFKPARAVVYALPFRGAKGRIQNDECVFDKPRPKAEKTERKTKKGKTVRSKSGAKIRATPKKVAEPVVQTSDVAV